jgi:hypothetical protein
MKINPFDGNYNNVSHSLKYSYVTGRVMGSYYCEGRGETAKIKC